MPRISIFTEDNTSTIILANGVTIDELNKEKGKTIEKVCNSNLTQI
jgi:hypothetical protein